MAWDLQFCYVTPLGASCGDQLCWQTKRCSRLLWGVCWLKFWRASITGITGFSVVGSVLAFGRRESPSRTFCEFFGNSRRVETRGFLLLAISKCMAWISIESIPVEWLLTHTSQNLVFCVFLIAYLHTFHTLHTDINLVRRYFTVKMTVPGPLSFPSRGRNAPWPGLGSNQRERHHRKCCFDDSLSPEAFRHGGRSAGRTMRTGLDWCVESFLPGAVSFKIPLGWWSYGTIRTKKHPIYWGWSSIGGVSLSKPWGIWLWGLCEEVAGRVSHGERNETTTERRCWEVPCNANFRWNSILHIEVEYSWISW